MKANPRDIILQPVVSEQSMSHMGEGKYTFKVSMGANKTQIRQAIQEIFKVRVQEVNTMHVHGKTRRMGRTQGRLPDWKKAVVKLEPGQKIPFFEGMST